MDVITILGAVGAGTILVELVRAWLGRRKTAADTADVITRAAREAVGLVREDNVRLRVEVAALTAEVVELRREMGELRAQMCALEDENLVLLRRLAEWDPGAVSRHEE